MTYKLLSILLFIVLALGGCGKKVTQVTITEWEQFQDPLYHDKGTVADLAAAVRPNLEALLP